MTAVVLLGGRFDRVSVDLTGTPPRIEVDGDPYERIDDPETGTFLGAYAAPFNH